MKVLKKEKKKGFTLIELIVVIAILAILALVAVPRLSSFKDSAKKSNDLTNAKNISNVVQLLLANGELKEGEVKNTGEYVIDTPIKVEIPAGVPANTGELIGSKLKSSKGTTLESSKGKSFYVIIKAKEEVEVYNGDPKAADEKSKGEKVFPQS